MICGVCHWYTGQEFHLSEANTPVSHSFFLLSFLIKPGRRLQRTDRSVMCFVSLCSRDVRVKGVYRAQTARYIYHALTCLVFFCLILMAI